MVAADMGEVAVTAAAIRRQGATAQGATAQAGTRVEPRTEAAEHVMEHAAADRPPVVLRPGRRTLNQQVGGRAADDQSSAPPCRARA